MFTTRRLNCHTIFMLVFAVLWNGAVFVSLYVSIQYIIHASALRSWERQQCTVESYSEYETIGCWGPCGGTRQHGHELSSWRDEPHLLVHA